MKAVIENIKAILSSYSDIFFIESYVVGGILLLATFLNPNLAIAGIISVLSAYFFAKFLKMEKTFLSSGYYTYNSLLVGLSVGYLFKITPLTVFFTITSGIITLVFSIMLYNIFSYYFRLPILSLPFVVISSTIYLAVVNYSNLFVSSLYPHIKLSFIETYMPLWVSGYLKSLGSILFLPDVAVGLLIALILLFVSRILFMLSLLGYYSGTIASALLTGSFQQAFNDLSHFNFILIAMALGGVFLIPSIKSYFVSVVAVLSSNILLSAVKTFWALYSIPAFTLPFNFITLLFIYVLGLVGFPLVAKVIRRTPEETLDFYLTNLKRYRGYDTSIHLPFVGQWTVWQGFDGKWTHKGSWRYAYDFVITDEEGKTYRGEGYQLTDYYAYRKPVLSPTRGRVVKVVSDLPDNPIGQVDRENSWGNLVIIQSDKGFYVEISHFAQYSIKVKEGDWVEVGSFLGLCGNSGYSPQPHIHIQVQSSPEIGAYTIPFSFSSYISENRFYSNDLPKEGQVVEPAYPDKSLELKMTFILDYQFEYEIFENGQKKGELVMVVEMSPDGTFYFNSGKGKLYFGKRDGTFYFYRLDGEDRYLKALFMSLPRLPLTYREGLQWEDYIPIRIVIPPLRKSLILFLSSFYHNFATIQYTGKWVSENKIKGKVKAPMLNVEKEATVVLDEVKGISSVEIDGIQLKLKGIKYTKEEQ
ncbi:MAG: peptidoglycan DD-metalloendopeptidase family protein [Aquificae bacterium]|nr:peptidoglycan DD-metalloendopeptidase family protein [Aquificota bacterium]